LFYFIFIFSTLTIKNMHKTFEKFFPPAFIFIVWFVFAFPFLFKNLTPYPSRYQTTFFGPWSAYSQFSSPVKNDAMPDIVGQIYPWKFFTIQAFKNHEIPLWNPYSFSGTPHLANYQSGVFSITNLGFFVMPFVDWWTMSVIFQPLFAGFFMYFFMSTQLKKKETGLISSLSFMFCGFITSWMGYATLGYAILFLPLSLFFIELYLKHKKNYYLAFLTLTVPLSFFSGHFQISIYFLATILAYILFKFIVEKNIKCFILLNTSILAGIFLSMPQLLPTFELYSQSVRGTIVQKIEAIPWVYLPTLFAPDYYGNPVTRNAWLGHYAEWNGYIGIIGLFFTFFAFTRKKSSLLFFTTVGVLSLFLSYDTPLLDLFIFLKVPVLSTSAASRIIVLFSFSAAVLSGFGLEYFFEDVYKHKIKRIGVIYGIYFLLFALLWLIPVLHIGLTDNYSDIAKSNLKLPTVLIISFTGLTAALFLLNKKLNIKIFLFILVAVSSFEMLRFSMKWLPYDPKSLVYPSVPVTSYFGKISGYNRVFGGFGAEDSVFYRLPGIEGYDALYINRYGQFIKYILEGKLANSERSGVVFPKQSDYSLGAANFLGVRYIVHKISDGQNVWEFPFWKYDPKSIILRFDDKAYQVLENTNAFPRAFLVKNLIVERSDKKILSKMFSTQTNLKDTAIIEEPVLTATNNGGSAEIKVYTPNRIEIETVTSSSSFLVLTDSYYPGWEATVDGRDVHIFRTDYAFRGIEVSKGKHLVVFRYFPQSFRNGLYIAIIGLTGVIFFLLSSFIKHKK